ncbi:hypothetical protein A2U01_0080712, partial [Trifolium medium]|nr:hypothetical protein [Trifolium medium]
MRRSCCGEKHTFGGGGAQRMKVWLREQRDDRRVLDGLAVRAWGCEEEEEGIRVC